MRVPSCMRGLFVFYFLFFFFATSFSIRIPSFKLVSRQTFSLFSFQNQWVLPSSLKLFKLDTVLMAWFLTSHMATFSLNEASVDGNLKETLKPSCIPWVALNDLATLSPSKNLKVWSFASVNSSFSCVRVIPELVDGFFLRTSAVVPLVQHSKAFELHDSVLPRKVLH